MNIKTEQQLITVSLALIKEKNDLSPQERAIAASAQEISVDNCILQPIKYEIEQGDDPLGEAFVSIRSAQERRQTGAFYTPFHIVYSMIRWLLSQGQPVRIVDPGSGSGRFILAAGQAFPDAKLLAIESNPLAALTLRANLSVRGLTKRTMVFVSDYRKTELEPCEGVTAFIGNPPYVRHHDIDEHWKAWYASKFAKLGIKASKLAGLHSHFFLQTRLLATPGDIGVFITSAEWLDVNYGASLRWLLLEELGGLALHVLEPAVEAFPGTATTAAITCFRVGVTEQPVRVRSVSVLKSLNGLSDGDDVPRKRLYNEHKWSCIIRPSARQGDGEIELGELFHVHRGQVTGANNIWVVGEREFSLPAHIQKPAVTRAKELFDAGEKLESTKTLRRVVDIPPDLSEFSEDEQRHIDQFLAWASLCGADRGYIAKHRKPWWSVGLRAPAPILCTYMARRPPQFTLNMCGARHINVAHGLYPRMDINQDAISRLVRWLNNNVGVSNGRTYAGGLTKFEPKEIERLRIPRLETLP